MLIQSVLMSLQTVKYYRCSRGRSQPVTYIQKARTVPTLKGSRPMEYLSKVTRSNTHTHTHSTYVMLAVLSLASQPCPRCDKASVYCWNRQTNISLQMSVFLTCWETTVQSSSSTSHLDCPSTHTHTHRHKCMSVGPGRDSGHIGGRMLEMELQRGDIWMQ